jgi:hypothetical protein
MPRSISPNSFSAVTMITGMSLVAGSFFSRRDLESAHLGHHHVQENQIRLVLGDQIQGLDTVAGGNGPAVDVFEIRWISSRFCVLSSTTRMTGSLSGGDGRFW